MNYYIKYSLVTTCAISLATLLSFLLYLDDPYWSALTAFAIMGPNTGKNFTRGLERFIGTLLGAIIGLLLSTLIADSNTILFLLMVFTISIILLPFVQITQHPYAVLLGYVTCLLILSSSITSPNEVIKIAMLRTSEISLGVISVWFTSLIFKDEKFIATIKINNIINHHHVIRTCCAVILAFFLWLLSNYPGGLQGIVSVVVISTKIELEKAMKHAAQRRATSLKFC